jgi:hypothetical protein
MAWAKGNKLGKRIQPGEALPGAGRPKLLINRLKEEGLSKKEMEEGISKLMLMDIEEIRKIKDNKESSMLELIVCNALLKAMANGDYSQFDQILTRVFGQSKQAMDLQTAQIIKVIRE